MPKRSHLNDNRVISKRLFLNFFDFCIDIKNSSKISKFFQNFSFLFRPFIHFATNYNFIFRIREFIFVERISTLILWEALSLNSAWSTKFLLKKAKSWYILSWNNWKRSWIGPIELIVFFQFLKFISIPIPIFKIYCFDTFWYLNGGKKTWVYIFFSSSKRIRLFGDTNWSSNNLVINGWFTLTRKENFLYQIQWRHIEIH